ncbi:hypothetical protein NDU88_000300 [Pleurodeles waltl]|uniref:Uncharacterized protein n=1 Tax=Pleurodeles waltl TaxID=8319 RepID=A0AAV7S6K5_PLEWA|nr:hypothetical protein NDU88_000300 [Pleurodeles waltl]
MHVDVQCQEAIVEKPLHVLVETPDGQCKVLEEQEKLFELVECQQRLDYKLHVASAHAVEIHLAGCWHGSSRLAAGGTLSFKCTTLRAGTSSLRMRLVRHFCTTNMSCIAEPKDFLADSGAEEDDSISGRCPISVTGAGCASWGISHICSGVTASTPVPLRAGADVTRAIDDVANASIADAIIDVKA